MINESNLKLISICIPVLNEEENIELAVTRVHSVFDNLDKYEYELIFTDNNSSDNTFKIIEELVKKYPNIKAARFSKNIGFQNSILTGFLLAKGSAVIQLDCDMQDPPEIIPSMLQKWEEGYEIVYGIRTHRQEGKLITAARKIFYRLLAKISETALPQDAGDFRLIDKKILTVLKQMDDKNPYLRGTISSIGFNQIGIPYKREARTGGNSKFNLLSLFGLATDAIVSHSSFPLRFATYIGVAFTVLSFIYLAVILFAKLALNANWPAGFATLVTLHLLNFAFTGFLFGIIGAYIGRIFRQSKQAPIAIIERRAGELSIDDTENTRIIDFSQINNGN